MLGNYIEKDGETQRVYDATLVGAAGMKSLGNPLAARIVAELARQPQCAMDVARNLKENEQKIYYHLRSLEKAGIVEKTGEEQRYGMIAKLFRVVSPIVAAKLYDEFRETKRHPVIKNESSERFLFPFINERKLNARIIIGDPYPHGPFDEAATDGVYAVELGLFLGRLLNEIPPSTYKLDTEVVAEDMKENLILIGNAKSNIIIDKINDSLPAYFDKSGYIVSKASGKTYKDARNGILIKMRSPHDKTKKILLIGGVRGRGTRSAILALINHTEEIAGSEDSDGNAIKILEGFDKDSDRIIDHVKFHE